MERYIKSSIIVLLLLSIALACDGTGNNNTTTRTIGPEGGTVRSSDGKLTLEIPAGALDEDTEISIKRINPEDLPPEFGDIDTDRQYELEPDGLEFNIPITAETRSNGGTVDENGDVVANLMFLLTSLNGELEILDNLDIEINADENDITVRGSLDHFSPLVETVFRGIFKIIIQNVPDSIPINELFNINVLLDITQDTEIEFVIEEARYDDDSSENLVLLTENTVFIASGANFFDDLKLTYQCLANKGFYDSFITFSFSSILLPEGTRRRVGMAFFGKDIICTGGPEPTPTPPPPPPSPPPTEPPVVPMFGAFDINGTWRFDCDVIMEAFPLIVPNLGDPFTFNADVVVDPETLETRINPEGGIFTLDGSLIPFQSGNFLFNGSGSGFLVNPPPPGAANIQLKAEDWEFAIDPIMNFTREEETPGNIILKEGLLRFNFPTLPLDSQSSTADCVGIKTGE